MTHATVLLDSIDKVRDFVDTLTKFKSGVDMVKGSGTLDARSIMGLFSFDLSKPHEIIIHDEGETDSILKAISQYIVK